MVQLYVKRLTLNPTFPKASSTTMTVVDARKRSQTISLRNGDPIPNEDLDNVDAFANDFVAVLA